jgi:hypothetical protein
MRYTRNHSDGDRWERSREIRRVRELINHNFLPRGNRFSRASRRIAMYRTRLSATALALCFLYLSPSPHLFVFCVWRGQPFMAAFLQVVWVGDPQRVSIYQSHNTTLCKQTEGQWDALALHSISLCPGTKRLCDASRPGRCDGRRRRHACGSRGIIPL